MRDLLPIFAFAAALAAQSTLPNGWKLPPAGKPVSVAATPLYRPFGTTADLTGYKALPPRIGINEKNTAKSYGARASQKMDFDNVDEAPIHALNEILWKSVKGEDSPMPLPIHRYRCCEEPQPGASRLLSRGRIPDRQAAPPRANRVPPGV